MRIMSRLARVLWWRIVEFRGGFRVRAKFKLHSVHLSFIIKIFPFLSFKINSQNAEPFPLGLLDVSVEGICHRALIIDSLNHCPNIGRNNKNILWHFPHPHQILNLQLLDDQNLFSNSYLMLFESKMMVVDS